MQLSFFAKLFGFSQNPVKRDLPDRPTKTGPRANRSDALLKGIWLDVRREWFPRNPELDSYSVRWSVRGQKRTLASCYIERKQVNVARELNCDAYLEWLDPLLYHEMCHAYLGDCAVGRKDIAHRHGREFKALERRHPKTRAFNTWLRAGGWQTAVRSDRAKRAYAKRACG